MPQQKFGPAYRLRKSNEFERVFRNAQMIRASNQTVTVYACLNEYQHARLGMAVSRKVAKNATVRNRVKRLIRTSFYQHLKQLPQADIVVICRHHTGKKTSQEWFQVLENAWQQLTNKVQQKYPSSTATNDG